MLKTKVVSANGNEGIYLKKLLQIFLKKINTAYMHMYTGADPENFSRGGPTLSKIDSV